MPFSPPPTEPLRVRQQERSQHSHSDSSSGRYAEQGTQRTEQKSKNWTMGDCPVGQIDLMMGQVMGRRLHLRPESTRSLVQRGGCRHSLGYRAGESWAPKMFTSQFPGPANGTFYGKRGHIPLYGKRRDEVKDLGLEGLSREARSSWG